MSVTSGARRVSRCSPHATAQAYNAARPDAPMPVGPDARNVLWSFTCAGAGLIDDLIASEKIRTLDFLPGGAPGPGEADRVGTVVASRWGDPPYLVLAENVSLRMAWGGHRRAVAIGPLGRCRGAVESD